MMTRLWLLLCCVAVVLPLRAVGGQNVTVMGSLTMQDEWTRWKKQYAKVYPGEEEEEYRRQLFYQNLQKIQEHNTKFPVLVSFTQGLNQFSDMTVEEYNEYNRLQPGATLTYRCGSTHRAVAGENLPDSVDWRKWGYVTPVLNQGPCGSCWAFSSTGAIEGQIFKRTRRLVPLSKQQLVDCSRSVGNSGCRGGWMDNAFLYVMREWGGLEWETDYPYTGRDGYCSADFRKEKAKIHGCVDVRSMDEQALKRATALVGPISVAIDASHPSFMSYRGGIYQEQQCSKSVLNHAVLVVGYGTLQGRDYWLIKNSWGTTWGMGGYAMIARNQYNMCGIATSASYPVV